MSSYADRVHHCDDCGFGTHAEEGELLPDQWRKKDGREICTRCGHLHDSAYLREHGWTFVRAALDDVPDGGVWADPLGKLRHQPLAKAAAEQQKRDGYGQLDMLGEAS